MPAARFLCEVASRDYSVIASLRSKRGNPSIKPGLLRRFTPRNDEQCPPERSEGPPWIGSSRLKEILRCEKHASG